MSMTLEDAYRILECMAIDLTWALPGAKEPMLDVLRQRLGAINIAQAALRPVSREAWTAKWTVDEFGHKCSKCGEYLPDGEDVRKPQFCPECGRAMTDEAVEMVMERLEAMKDGK